MQMEERKTTMHDEDKKRLKIWHHLLSSLDEEANNMHQSQAEFAPRWQKYLHFKKWMDFSIGTCTLLDKFRQGFSLCRSHSASSAHNACSPIPAPSFSVFSEATLPRQCKHPVFHAAACSMFVAQAAGKCIGTAEVLALVALVHRLDRQ